jgi:hypothetical protein
MMKKEMDEREGGTWHCIVGTHFGSFVSHGMHVMLRIVLSYALCNDTHSSIVYLT